MKVISVINSFTDFDAYHRFTGILIDKFDICFYKNNKRHREVGGAVIIDYASFKKRFLFYYKDNYHGEHIHTNKSWIKKVKELKRKERLSIFI